MKVWTALLASVALAAVSSAATATELGGGSYPNGTAGFASAALPPRGTYLLLYYQHYGADRFNGSDGQVLIPDFKVRADAAVARLVHVWNARLFGADVASQLIVPVIHLNVGIGPAHDDDTSIGDVTVTPVILGWHFSPEMHAVAAVDVNLPTGPFDPTRLANIGRHYLNVEPVLAFAYYGKQGVRLDLKAMYDFNFRNRDGAFSPFNPTGAAYRSGQELHVDFGLGEQLGKTELGISGYWYRQTTRDRVANPAAQAEIDSLDGFEGRAFAVGPSAKLNVGKDQFIAAWLHETGSAYRPRGNKLWLTAIVPL